MPPLFVQINAWKFGLPSSSPGRSENPTTTLRLLMATGVFHATPPRLPRLVTLPFCQSRACAALNDPTATKQVPEMPTTCP